MMTEGMSASDETQITIRIYCWLLIHVLQFVILFVIGENLQVFVVHHTSFISLASRFRV